MKMGLLVTHGSNEGEYYPLNDLSSGKGSPYSINYGITNIGRDTANDIQINDEGISLKHCQIIKDRNTCRIRSLTNKKDIILNGTPIEEGILHINDTIRIGKTNLTLTSNHRIQEQKPLFGSFQDWNKHVYKNAIRLSASNSLRLFEPDLMANDPEQLFNAYQNLFALFQIGTTINSFREVSEVFKATMDIIFKVFKKAERGVLMTFDNETGEMIPRIVKHRNKSDKDKEALLVSRRLIDYIISNHEAILNQGDDPKKPTSPSLQNRISNTSVMCSPILSNGNLLGLIYIDCESSHHKFDENNLQMFISIVEETGRAIENASLFEELHALFLDTIKTIVTIIDSKDSYTRGHSERVSVISMSIADELNLPKKDKESLRLSSLLHDIGKIKVPEKILNKKSKLTQEEEYLIKKHPETGANIISNIKNLEDVILGIRHHHEKFDGNGYPYGLHGKDIPLIARIISVADAFDAIISQRPYREARNKEEAVAEIKKHSGSQFDPEIVDAFLKALKKSLFVFPNSYQNGD